LLFIPPAYNIELGGRGVRNRGEPPPLKIRFEVEEEKNSKQKGAPSV